MTQPIKSPRRYREVTVTGLSREMGRQIGEAMREEIREFCQVALQRVNRTIRISQAKAMQVVAETLPFARHYRPDYVDELEGMAEASGVSLPDILLLQVRNQLQPERDAGCTSVSIAGSATANGHSIVAQNWDNDPELDRFTVVLTRRPAGKPAFITVTQAGLIAYIGFNEAGIGACLNSLPAPARTVGVPHYLQLREAYEATSLAGAVQAVDRAHRAIPANIMMTTPEGPANLEVTLDQVRVLQGNELGYLTHTNHCLHPDLVAINGQFPELIESGPRQGRIGALLSEQQRPFTVPAMQKILADHENFPRSICRHANDHPQHGFWTTVLSVVMQPTDGKMFVSRGNPCTQPYEQYRLDA